MIGDAVLNADERKKAGNSLYGAYGQDFICADGRRVMIIGLTRRQWSGIVKATGTADQMAALAQRVGADLNDEGARWRFRHEITALLAPWFAARRVDQFASDFNAMGLTWSEFRTTRDAVRYDPDLSDDNPMFKNLHQPGLGAFPVPSLPTTFSAHPRQDPVAAPELGSHTEEILGDVARLSDTEIAQLFDQGVVESPSFSASQSAA